MFESRNLLSRAWLRFKDPAAYRPAPRSAAEFRSFTLTELMALHQKHGALHFSHSGNSGDIIYALPTLKRIFELTGIAPHLFLRLDQPMDMSVIHTHPLGTVMLNQKMADLLLPLLRDQPYLAGASVWKDELVHVDLDLFRVAPIPRDQSNIGRWCGYITGISPELWKKWLEVVPDTRYAEHILLARSERYRNTSIDHAFLSRYRQILFVGVESEYRDMQQRIPGLQWLQVADFKELAGAIAGCKLFIGNQSFPFSLAEALKVPRILESHYHVTNVIPEGENGHSFFFQGHLEGLVEEVSWK